MTAPSSSDCVRGGQTGGVDQCRDHDHEGTQEAKRAHRQTMAAAITTIKIPPRPLRGMLLRQRNGGDEGSEGLLDAALTDGLFQRAPPSTSRPIDCYTTGPCTTLTTYHL
ncbi:hypothetical protein BST61_g10584 [Cercospora zeina]